VGFVDFKVSEWKVIADNIMLKGKLMYTRDDMTQFVKMLEAGMLPGELVDVKIFGLDKWQEAFDIAAEHTGLGKLVAFEP
jgi:threonine dehydrogenase-like Zn-dependent dehydrogenase